MFKKNNYFSNSLKYKIFVVLFTLLLLLPGCQSGSKSSPKSRKQQASSVPTANTDYYQEIGREIGLDFIHTIGDDHLDNIVESVGGGAAFLDYDQDGFIDIYVCNGTWIEGFSHS
jgi:hypothetical protein